MVNPENKLGSCFAIFVPLRLCGEGFLVPAFPASVNQGTAKIFGVDAPASMQRDVIAIRALRRIDVRHQVEDTVALDDTLPD